MTETNKTMECTEVVLSPDTQQILDRIHSRIPDTIIKITDPVKVNSEIKVTSKDNGYLGLNLGTLNIRVRRRAREPSILGPHRATQNRELTKRPDLPPTNSANSTSKVIDNTKFTMFPNLPLEIRRKIWKAHIENIEAKEPRVEVELRDYSDMAGLWGRGNEELDALITVNHEVREEVLGVGGYVAIDLKPGYIMPKQTWWESWTKKRKIAPRQGKRKILFHPSKNILYIRKPADYFYLRDPYLASKVGLALRHALSPGNVIDMVKCVALDDDLDKHYREDHVNYWKEIMQSLRHYGNLELVLIDYSQHDQHKMLTLWPTYKLCALKPAPIGRKAGDSTYLYMPPTFHPTSTRPELAPSGKIYKLSGQKKWQTWITNYKDPQKAPRFEFVGREWKMTKADFNTFIALEKDFEEWNKARVAAEEN